MMLHDLLFGLSNDQALLAAVLLPFFGAVLLVLVGRWPNLRETVTLLTALCLFALTVSILGIHETGEVQKLVLFDVVPGVPLAFSVEPLGIIFGLVASGLWIIT